MNKADRRKNRKRKDSTTVLVLIMMTGIALLVYPTTADYWNSFHQSHAISEYMETVSQIDDESFHSMWEEADWYNQSLLKKQNRYYLDEEEMKTYESILKVNVTGIMSYVEIPSLKISLPIYHGTDETTLKIAIGHIPGSSLPVGGPSTHCVISGHRGLPSAKLFTEIDQLKKGDTFFLETLGETLTYEVDQIRIVLPNELEDIEIEEGKDYCTLVTCTPYGVNSHRLLVRGHRVGNTEDKIHVTAEAVQISEELTAVWFGILFLLVIMIISAVRLLLRRGRSLWMKKNFTD